MPTIETSERLKTLTPDQARDLKHGETIFYQSDDNPGRWHSGKVEKPGGDTCTNHQGIKYCWVSVRVFGAVAVYPSNRLHKT